MIPQFPLFKALELSDKEDVEKFTLQYPPYSDFNFVSMWSWNIEGEMQISQLNDNLVVRFTDYLTDKHFFSFLGNKKINETTHLILNLSKKEGLGTQLKLIPEDSIKGLDANSFFIQEDDNHFDYIYSLNELKLLRGKKFETKRGSINRFLGKNKTAHSKVINPLETRVMTDILKLNYHWVEQKKLKDPYFEIKNELIAIDRFLNSNNPSNYCCVGIFLDEMLLGYSINEIISSDYSIGHFIKTHKEGSFEYLMRETAHHLSEINIEFFNFEQDLGIPGLRKSKSSYRPVNFLKKYIISLKE